MSEPKTPAQTRKSTDLAILQKTTSSVYQSRMPARSSRHLKHSHGLAGGRLIKRLDKQSWEERLAKILHVVEKHRYQKNNALHFALANVKGLLDEVEKKKADMEIYMEELQASNEEMRILQKDAERTHQDTEGILSQGPDAFEAPLGKIGAYARDLKETYGAQLDPEAVERLGYMAEQAGRMEESLTGLLDYWRVDMEGRPFRTVDCESILERAEKDLEKLMNSAGAEITHDPLPAVNGDRDQIALLFNILLKRAALFPGDHPPHFHVTASPKGEGDKAGDPVDTEMQWDFRVEDNCAEIPEEDRKRIFMVLPDHAMDMAIAWRIVNRHGGKMTVVPKKGGGNVFQFSLMGH